jgi:glycosyltransferase involved in cell wall biosynthesis
MIFLCDKCKLEQRIELDEFPMGCRCGEVYRSPVGHVRRPPLAQRIARYGMAVARHVASGMRTRSNDEVARILRTYCAKPCRWYDGQTCTHGRCGCRVNGKAGALVNKIRMATQSCPIGLWGPAARPRGQISVGFLTPGLRDAGAERWVTWMTHACSAAAIRVEAVIQVSGKERTDSLLASEIRQTCPIYHDAIVPASVLEKMQILLSWGGGGMPPTLHGFKGSRVFVNHSSTKKATEMGRKALELGCQHFVAVSRKSAQFMPAEVDCAVIHNGVDIDRCLPSKDRAVTRKRWGVADDAKCVGFIGRPHKDKRPDLLPPACALLPEVYTPVFIGRFNKHEKQMLAAAGRPPVFAPHTPHIGDVLAALDCFCLISEHEAMNLATCEAWAAGVPVVSTPVGAVPELEEQHGRLTVRVPIGASPAAVAQAIETATSKDNEETVERAAEVVRRHYSLEAMGRRWTSYLLAVGKYR